MSQSSRVNQLISRLNALNRPKPNIVDEAGLAEANQIFLGKLSELRKSKIEKENHFVKPVPKQTRYFPPQNVDLKSLHGLVDCREETQPAPKRKESVDIFVSPYRPARIPREAYYLQDLRTTENQLLMCAKQDPNLKVKEWLKNNARFIPTSGDNKNIRPRRSKKEKYMNKKNLKMKEVHAKKQKPSYSSSQEDSDYFDGNSFEK